jgi:hypothetical protein
MIGTVVVAALAARAALWFPTITATCRRIKSATSRQPIKVIFRRAVFDRDVLRLDEACFLEALAQRSYEVRGVGE